MKVRAKFRCQSVTDYGHYTSAKLSAIYGTEGENKDFADATPSGDITIGINKGRPAADAIKPGQDYYVDFTPADEPAPAAQS